MTPERFIASLVLMGFENRTAEEKDLVFMSIEELYVLPGILSIEITRKANFVKLFNNNLSSSRKPLGKTTIELIANEVQRFDNSGA